MFEADQICPYTGLRAFTEEESLYFKGREEHIDQATEQLQRNKFLMLTGASGDGKSSLIYAGIIPNARAGFLKSKYTQWCVADFRPERTPFRNLYRSIARQLDISNPYSVQAELNHGFSAIIDLYKNSKRYLDTSSMAWQLADDAGKAALKREAANLIILVDQFEEFFTNPENYNKGVPSRDANLVLNLLLETARIALEEDLPVYIVFTMRSDYIGQCASFRGLPEYIGFSQFFVPRLNRTQLQQVIEEPATLSGNRITRRLTERLIHDLTEGVDQLPILQHALNQVWHAADDGKEEMDLIHYAMVGGMPVNELPDEQVERFKKWFEDLPLHIKACYHKPDLQNVLDTHTNKLYEQAAEYFAKKTGKKISDEDAKAIIRTAFICLTKIDQSRAVRNRMTLKEITNIFGRPEFGTNEVGEVLNIFREPGNTFIRPFILDDSDSQTLNDIDVLDITHESLIRNWEYLEQWAKEEFDNYTISLDFEQQLNRWVKSDKSNGFLLSIGPLTYFEHWFNTTKPNAHWIARYLPEEIDQDSKLSKAKLILGNAQEFLTRSAGKHVVTRTIMRYGPKRIAAVLAVIAVVTLSSFAIRDYLHRQNSYVLKTIKKQTFELANMPKLSPEFPVPAITEQLIMGNLTIPEVIEAIKDTKQKIKIATGIAAQLVSQGRYEPKKEILQSLTIADSLLEQLPITGDSRGLSEKLKLIRDFSVAAGFGSFFNQDELFRSIVTRNAKRSARWAIHIFKEQPEGFSDIQNLSLALDEGINHSALSPEEISQLLKILSPFENSSRTLWVEKNYQRDKVLIRGGNDYGPRFNGLYQDLAYLYAALGKPGMVLQCMDSLLRYQEGFHQNDYATHTENATNIAAVFYVYGTTNHLDSFVQGYCKRKNTGTTEFYDRLVSRALIDIDLNFNLNFYAGGGGQEFSNLNIKFSSDQILSFFFTKLKEEIMKIGEKNERNFNLAVFLKNERNLFAYRKEIRGIVEEETDQQYKEAVGYYKQVSKEYLDQPVSVIGSSALDLVTMPRKYLFLYPDYRVPFHPFEPRRIAMFYNSPSFIKYVLDKNLFDTLYQSADELKYFEHWLYDYHVAMSSRNLFLYDPMPGSIMEQLASKLEERKANQSADLNILYLHLGEHAFNLKEKDKGIEYLKKIRTDKLLNTFRSINFDFVNNYSFELVGKAVAHLAANNQFDLAYTFISVFKKEVNRSSLYAYASQLISLNKQSPETAKRLLDSARVEMNRLDNLAAAQPNRHQVAIALMYTNPEKNSVEAYRIIKNRGNKFQSITRFSSAYAFQGSLYKAQQQAPNHISAGDKAFFFRYSIEGFNLTEPEKPEWKKFKENEMIFTRNSLPYVNENQ
jgi:energy-coupling factor transporter ATP-binding protein EcfA2